MLNQCPFASQADPQTLKSLLDSTGRDPNQLFWKFHGPSGIVPLHRFDLAPETCPAVSLSSSSAPSVCPATGLSSSSSSSGFGACPFAHASASSSPSPSAPSPSHALQSAPFASIGFRFPFFGPGGNGNNGPNRKKPKNNNHQAKFRQNSAPEPAPESASSSNPPNPANSKGGPAPTPGENLAQNSNGGRCPMRRFYEPAVAALTAVGAFGPKMQIKLQCPAIIVQARAALAKTPLAIAIRHQVLPKKLVAVGALSLLTNLPLGMIREHTEKFSWQWLVVVHASIPFVAMLRKATVLPKYSIAMTIASAIVGQAIGAALERQRMREGAGAISQGSEIPSISPANSISKRGISALPPREKDVGIAGFRGDSASDFARLDFASITGGKAKSTGIAVC